MITNISISIILNDYIKLVEIKIKQIKCKILIKLSATKITYTIDINTTMKLPYNKLSFNEIFLRTTTFIVKYM